MSSNRFRVALVAAVLVLGTLALVAALRAGPSGAQQNVMHNCPQAGKWAISVWDGLSGTEAADALATCGADAVAAAYSLDPQTQVWSGWFAGQPELSNLAPLNDRQGLLTLGGAAATGAESPAAAPTANQMRNCPLPGKWSIAVWDGPSGTAPAEALATCGEVAVGVLAVAQACSIDRQTQLWYCWFAAQPELSNLPPLDALQGLLAWGAAAPPEGPEPSTPSTPPTSTPTPSPTATATPGAGGEDIWTLDIEGNYTWQPSGLALTGKISKTTIPLTDFEGTGTVSADFSITSQGECSGSLVSSSVQMDVTVIGIPGIHPGLDVLDIQVSGDGYLSNPQSSVVVRVTCPWGTSWTETNYAPIMTRYPCLLPLVDGGKVTCPYQWGSPGYDHSLTLTLRKG